MGVRPVRRFGEAESESRMGGLTENCERQGARRQSNRVDAAAERCERRRFLRSKNVAAN